MYIAHGSYLGNATARNITDADGTGSGTPNPFNPLGETHGLVMVKGRAARVARIWTTTTGALAQPMGPVVGLQSSEITGFVTGGFSIGSDSDVNAMGETFDWVMMVDGGHGDLYCGNYTGTGVDNRNITAPGFQGDYWISFSVDGTVHANHSHTTECWSWSGFGSPLTDRWQGWLSTGFQVGTLWNETDKAYYYVVVKRRTGVCWTFTYVGNGADDRSISGFGLSPNAFFVTRGQGSAGTVTRYGSQTGDASSVWDQAQTTNKVQAVEAAGVQIGTDANVNFNTLTYFGAAFADNVPPLTVIPGTAQLTLTAFAPTVTVTGNQLVTPQTANLGLTAFAPTVSVVSIPTITYVEPDSFGDAQPNIQILGQNFGATQGAGFVVISPMDNVNDPGRVVQPVTAWGQATNLVTNGGFETNTTGWFNGTGNTIAVSTEQAKYGLQSGKITFGSNPVLVNYPITLTASTAHRFSTTVYIPANWDGIGTVAIRINGFAGATGNQVNFLADMGLRNQWQRVICSFTPLLSDLVGQLEVVTTGGTPTVGRSIYIDGAQVQTGTLASPYIETNGATAAAQYAIFTSETTGL